jgi:hypothetical protein
MRATPGSTRVAYLEGAPTGLVTGSQLGFKVKDSADNIVIARTTAGMVESETGVYRHSFTVPNANGAYLIVWDFPATSVGVTRATEELEVGATSDTIAASILTSQITIVAPVAANGDITIIRGDDYRAADGRHLTWRDSTWPDLTGATATFTSRSAEGSSAIGVSKLCGIVVPSGAGKEIRVEFTDNETNAHVADEYRFDIRAVLSDGNRVTLVRGHMFIADQVVP